MFNTKKSTYVLTESDVDRITSFVECVQDAIYHIIFKKQIKFSNQDPWSLDSPNTAEETVLTELKHIHSETENPPV